MLSVINQSPNDIRIFKIFKYCKESFRKAGIHVNFPKGTDPRKTYKWRYLENFSKKVDEWAVSDDTAFRIIDAIVQYAVESNQLHKGLSLLTCEKVLEVSLKSIDKSEALAQNLLDRIIANHNLVISTDPSDRTHSHALPNIVKWYMHGTISTTYLAISRRCHIAMMKLDRLERSMIPSGKELIKIRSYLFKDNKFKAKIKNIVRDDWRDDI